MTVALLDGDLIAYRAASAHNKSFDFGDGDAPSVSSSPAEAAEAALQTIAAWQTLAHCKEAIVCFTGKGNFRKHVLFTYKANRTKGKPPDYWHVVEAVSAEFPTRVIDGLEADDVLGLLATGPKYRDKSIVLTLDKDLRTVPAVHLNPVKETKPVRVSEGQADYAWLMQTLMGDPTDGYSGIPRVGPRRAEAILGPPVRASVGLLWGRVVAAYAKAKLPETVAIQMARVARILRFGEFHKDTKEVSLWHPTRTTERFALGTLFAAPSVT